MINIAKISDKEREALFRNTASKLGLSEAIIEKDFWVCYMLDYLFHRCKWKDILNTRNKKNIMVYILLE